MTKKSFDNKICPFKIILSWLFPRKTAFLDDLSSLHSFPPPPKNAKIYFFCRLTVSDKFERPLNSTKITRVPKSEFFECAFRPPSFPFSPCPLSYSLSPLHFPLSSRFFDLWKTLNYVPRMI